MVEFQLLSEEIFVNLFPIPLKVHTDLIQLLLLFQLRFFECNKQSIKTGIYSYPSSIHPSVHPITRQDAHRISQYTFSNSIIFVRSLKPDNVIFLNLL
jgi:hypothetical protein